MIFACDLDQTLIYSRKSMGLMDEKELVPVEMYEGDYLSYMTRTAMRSLQLLSRQIYFVPTTTRTYEQFTRIYGLNDGIQSRYAIVCNGGKVLVDGLPDMEWENRVRELVRKESAPNDEIKQRFDKLTVKGLVLKESYSDELFYSVVVNRELLPQGMMTELESQLQGLGWNCSIQGRKIYLVPDHVSKGSAVQYVKELAGARSVFAAGDSLLDESMLMIAETAMAPNHGELFRKYGTHNRIRFTERSGIGASEEILDMLMNRTEARSAL